MREARRFEDQRSQLAAATAEDDARDRNACRMSRCPRPTLGHWLGARRCTARWGARAARVPIAGARPCQSSVPSGGSSPMPSHHGVPSGASPTLVKIASRLSGAHRVGVGLAVGAGSDAEHARFGVDGPQPAVAADVHPGDVVAHRLDRVAGQARDEHREVGLAAPARKGRREVRRAPRGSVMPTMSMCSASHPSSRACTLASRKAWHFLASSALPP